MQLNKLWYYTPIDNLEEVIKKGVINPTSTTLGSSRRMIWLFSNSKWGEMIQNLDFINPTLQKHIQDYSGSRDVYIGRIEVIPTPDVMNWINLKEKAHTSQHSYDIINNICGESINKWFASFNPIGKEHWLSVKIRYKNTWIYARKNCEW